jgi:DNA-binding transcriptional MerR regulator
MFQTFCGVFVLAMPERFTSRQVIEITGLSARQLQWWDEQRLVTPEHEGHRRLYSFADLTEVAVVGELRARGFSLQRVRKVMAFLQRELGKRLADTVTGGADYHLLTDGESIYLRTSPQQVIDILKNSRQALFAICLSDTVRQVRAEVGRGKALPPGDPEAPGGETFGASSQQGKTGLAGVGAPGKQRTRARKREPQAAAHQHDEWGARGQFGRR